MFDREKSGLLTIKQVNKYLTQLEKMHQTEETPPGDSSQTRFTGKNAKKTYGVPPGETTFGSS